MGGQVWRPAGPWCGPASARTPVCTQGTPLPGGHSSQQGDKERGQNGAGTAATCSILWGLWKDGVKAGRCTWRPPNPHARPCEQLPPRLRLTTECAPGDQLGRDEEGAQLLHQLRVGEAAPPPQGVPVQRGDALGHEEAPVGRVAGEEGSLEVDGPRTPPRADVLHGCWGGTAVTARASPAPGTAPHPKLSPPAKLPTCTAELLREESASCRKKPRAARAAGAGGGDTLCGQGKLSPEFAARRPEASPAAFPAPFPPCPGDASQPEPQPGRAEVAALKCVTSPPGDLQKPEFEK